jgi:hypothetical protein
MVALFNSKASTLEEASIVMVTGLGATTVGSVAVSPIPGTPAVQFPATVQSPSPVFQLESTQKEAIGKIVADKTVITFIKMGLLMVDDLLNHFSSSYTLKEAKINNLYTSCFKNWEFVKETLKIFVRSE